MEKEGQIANAQHIHIAQLPGCLKWVSKNRSVYILYGSGTDSMVAASLLQGEGWENLAVLLGDLAGWNSTTCPIS